jgi:hypothetical protein
MPAAWTRINPAQLLMPGKGKMAVMVMAVAAKKHVTIFSRSRSAPGAGAPETKAAFTSAAHKTLGVTSRAERNAIIKNGVTGHGPGVRKVRSRGKTSFGKVLQEYRTR